MGFKVVIDHRELDAAIAYLKREAPGALEKGLFAGGLVLETKWKQLVPVRTGNYRRSIHTQVTAPGEITVGTDITDPPYPYFLEMGTSRMAARPSARPAFDMASGSAQQAALQALSIIFNRFGR